MFKESTTAVQQMRLPSIADKDLTSEASALTDGSAYIVAPSATSQWVGQSGKIAYYDQMWKFYTPVEGDQVQVIDEDAVYTYNGSVWVLTAGSPAVVLTAATVLTKTKHANRPLIVNNATGFAITLPAATGSGDEYEFYIQTAVGSGSTTIKAASAADSMLGGVVAQDTDSAGTGKFWAVAANDDSITLNGTSLGGKAGDVIRVKDVLSGVFLVEGFIKQSGGSEATPFSATVN